MNNNNFAVQYNNYEEIDERLFDSYLTISDRKSKSSPTLPPSVEMSSSSSSGEESDASSSHKPSSFNHNNNGHKNRNSNLRKNHTKPCKKEESADTSSVHSGESGETAEKKQKSLYKTELCRNWEETNHCRYGMKCQYAHGAADLREIDRHPKYKTQKCRTFHQTGACPYGNRCTFRHFNLPGDALEMKNLEMQEEEQKQQQQQQQQQQKDQQQQQQQPVKCPKQQQQKKAIQPPKVELVKEERPSIFSMDNQKLLQQNWFLNSHTLNGLGVEPIIPKRNLMLNNNNSGFDPEDSLLPSNAESLLPHQLLFDLESPEDEEVKQPARCPLRNYVNLPSFSTFQVPNHSQYMQQPHQQQHQDEQCNKTFFRPWLF